MMMGGLVGWGGRLGVEVECLLLLMMYCRDLVSGSLWMYVYWEDVRVVCVLGGCEGGMCIGRM